MNYKTKYNIEISEYKTDKISEPSVYMIQLDTNDLEWSMDQYQRNRQPLTYRVISSISEFDEFAEREDNSKVWSEEDSKIYTVAGLTNDKEGSFMKFQNKINKDGSSKADDSSSI